MYRLLRLPIRQTSATNGFLRSYASQPTAPSLTEGEKHIFDKLTKELKPSELLVQDVSGGCGSFYAITIASEQLKGLPILKQHRRVKEVLKEDMAGLHGLQLKVVDPTS
ncbi:bola-like protein [Thelephora terrestris]|uniref:Bola-like protein n=1 Tax=Thelephora terrestris TaxID=56493 RepID=A0A9P6H5Z0_9AGAM|nr:bola-like protein [Thelephora terrestris]